MEKGTSRPPKANGTNRGGIATLELTRVGSQDLVFWICGAPFEPEVGKGG